MKSSTATQQRKGLSEQAWTDHFEASDIEGYPDSEHLIAWDDRFSTGERFQREEQIRREVELALFVQKRSRARKAKKSASGAHETRADSSPESKWYDRDSFVDRARARQTSAYTPKMAPSGDLWYDDTSHSVSHGHINCPSSSRDFISLPDALPPSPRKSTLSRLNPFKRPGRKSSTSGVDDYPSSCLDEEDSSQESGSWSKKLQHIAIIIILGYDPDKKGQPIL